MADEMPLQPLPWLPVLEIGHADIDHQHRELIADANAVYELVVTRGDWDKLVAAMGKMHRDCALHFADENKLLESSGFSDAKVHALEHERVLEQVAHIHGIIRSAPEPTHFHWELALTLRSLLLDHFLRYDLQYKSHIMYHQPFKLPSET